MELDAPAQIKRPSAAAVRDLPALRQHGRQLAGLGIASQEILAKGLEDHVLGSGIQVRQPALVAEGGHRHGQEDRQDAPAPARATVAAQRSAVTRTVTSRAFVAWPSSSCPKAGR